MNIFEEVKENVSVRQAAEYYGVKVNRNRMSRCPFHEDRNPSMKLNEDYYYCFGCGATGDVIDFVAKLFDLSQYEAAQKVANDFGITGGRVKNVPVSGKSRYLQEKTVQSKALYCQRVLYDYLHLLEKWKVQYAPKAPGSSIDERFEEACQMQDYVEELTEDFMFADKKECLKMAGRLCEDGTIIKLEKRLKSLKEGVYEEPQIG